jgi:hypothetical protein
MHAGGPFFDPDVPLPIRPSRREARQARKRLKGRGWQEIPPAERVRLRTVVQARANVVNRRGARVIVAIIVLAACGAVFYGALELPPAIGAAVGRGTPGVFVARTEACDQVSCTWNGTFESATGRVLRRDVTYGDADRGMHAGNSVPALFPGGSDVVYAARGSAGWIEPALFLLLGVAVIAVWLYRGPGRYLRRLRDRRDLRGSLTQATTD